MVRTRPAWLDSEEIGLPKLNSTQRLITVEQLAYLARFICTSNFNPIRLRHMPPPPPPPPDDPLLNTSGLSVKVTYEDGTALPYDASPSFLEAMTISEQFSAKFAAEKERTLNVSRLAVHNMSFETPSSLQPTLDRIFRYISPSAPPSPYPPPNPPKDNPPAVPPPPVAPPPPSTPPPPSEPPTWSSDGERPVRKELRIRQAFYNRQKDLYFSVMFVMRLCGGGRVIPEFFMRPFVLEHEFGDFSEYGEYPINLARISLWLALLNYSLVLMRSFNECKAARWDAPPPRHRRVPLSHTLLDCPSP